jgi:hypothetical protein
MNRSTLCIFPFRIGNLPVGMRVGMTAMKAFVVTEIGAIGSMEKNKKLVVKTIATL